MERRWLLGLVALLAFPAAAHGQGGFAFEARSLDGSANNRAHPSWGQVGRPYRRFAPPAYRDGSTSTAGANPRFVSNRVFNDLGQNVFSTRVTQWAWTWGQFMDHTFGLAQDGTESRPIAFTAQDPLESFRNDLGRISFKRDAAAPGTGAGRAHPRQQVNTVSSYIDGWSVYGGTAQREEWLREGPVNGDLSDNGPHLLLTRLGFLPKATARGNAATAPPMKLDGQLVAHPQDAVIAGDQRANENLALTAVHTLFAREHNRIVDLLPPYLGAERRFQIARRVVGAEQQFITYTEFLPSLGVRLPPYRGYRPGVDAALTNEFATVAYRAHSMIHGEFEIGKLAVPLNIAFFNPDLVPLIGLGPVLGALGDEAQYRNDEQIDNSLRSVLFQLPGPGAPDPLACFSNPSAQGCFQGVVDLGAIDIERGRDHGMPAYNAMRRAYGLPAKRSFTAITGERTDRFPDGLGVNDPRSLQFTSLRDAEGHAVAPGSEPAADDVTAATRRSTLAARLKAIYRRPGDVDAFVGMMAEPHVPGTEFGPLQLAMWRSQFRALRDGDRFFYGHDPVLDRIRQRFGITYRHTLGDLIALDAGVSRGSLRPDVFRTAADDGD